MVQIENKGGKTGYYDLPLPSVSDIVQVLRWFVIESPERLEIIAESFQKLCPQTLNDLIEFKNMEPWQHEVFKACYAIEGRSAVKGSPRLRDINKIIYYAERAKAMIAESEVAPSPESPSHEYTKVREESQINLLAKVHWEWVDYMGWHTSTVNTLGSIVKTVGKAIVDWQNQAKLRLLLADIILKTLDVAYDFGIDMEAAIKDKIKLNSDQERK